jgi:lipoprotein-anchoring transpeptidase ErfK/SrfK
VEWAEGRLKQIQGGDERPKNIEPREPRAGIPIIREPVKSNPPAEKRRSRRVLLYGASFGFLACAVIAFAAWSAISSPALASLLENKPAPTQEKLWSQVEILKPPATPFDSGEFVQVPATNTAVIQPPTQTASPVSTPTETPTSIPTDTPIPTVTETPGVLAMDIVPDTPTSEYIPPTKAPVAAPPAAPAPPSGTRGGARWIDVDLTNQMVYAYEGDTLVNSFVVSTGTWLTPTVTGKYKIWIKLKKTNMSGPGYYLADVPYVMYFHKGYGLHGTYWHNNFGTPMSHGCVNLSIPDAEWLYYWASEGTVVNVHY